MQAEQLAQQLEQLLRQSDFDFDDAIEVGTDEGVETTVQFMSTVLDAFRQVITPVLEAKSHPVSATSVSGKKGHGRVNGYNLFVQNKMKGTKKSMVEVKDEWNVLTDAQKEEWKAKAKVANEANPAAQAKTKRAASGYNFYVQHEVKEKKRLFGTVTKEWKTLPQKDKDHWNQLAKEAAKNKAITTA